MSILDTISKSSSNVYKEWDHIMDSAIYEHPIFLQHNHDNLVMLNLTTLNNLFRTLKFHISLVPEDDDSITGTFEGLGLTENAASRESCVTALLKAMRTYAKNFYEEFAFWSTASNLKLHIPYVLKIFSSSDTQLRKDIVCYDKLF